MRAIWELFVLSLQLFGKSKTILKLKIYSNKKGKSNDSHRLHHQLISLTSNPVSHHSQWEPSTLPRWVFQGLTTQPPASTVLWAPTMRSSASLPPPFNTQDPTRLFGPRWGGPSSQFLPWPRLLPPLNSYTASFFPSLCICILRGSVVESISPPPNETALSGRTTWPFSVSLCYLSCSSNPPDHSPPPKRVFASAF